MKVVFFFIPIQLDNKEKEIMAPTRSSRPTNKKMVQWPWV
jgi:hypothetical protein